MTKELSAQQAFKRLLRAFQQPAHALKLVTIARVVMNGLFTGGVRDSSLILVNIWREKYTNGRTDCACSQITIKFSVIAEAHNQLVDTLLRLE